MEIVDYETFRDALIDAFEAYDLQTTIDEAIFLNTHSRGCEIYIHQPDESREVWAKLGFEWTATNQSFIDQLKHMDDAPADTSLITGDGFDVMIHASFHLHFGLLPVTTDAIRVAAEDIRRAGDLFFSDEGGVVAEVSMTADDARLDCLRYEVNTTSPMIVEESWWDQLAEVFQSMLNKLEDIFERLSYEYGSPRDPRD